MLSITFNVSGGRIQYWVSHLHRHLQVALINTGNPVLDSAGS